MAELPRPLPQPTWRDRLAGFQGVPVAYIGVLIGVVVAAIAATAVLAGGLSRSSTGDVALTLPRADGASGAAGGESSATTLGGTLHVHAAGAVVRPGVVTVKAGSRVTDVVAAAGGAAPDADLDQVNLAAPVADGERVYIPRRGETVAATPGGTAASQASDGIVNLNSADQAALETLPGVGPSTAQAILDYRKEHGRFRSVDELLNVRGIGPAKLSQIKPRVRV